VKGASEGAGLGNKFLSHIREVQIIAHVVRAFEDPSAGSGQVQIIREGSVDPKTDYEVINTELMLADVATLQKALENRKEMKSAKGGSASGGKKAVLKKTLSGINSGIPVYQQDLNEEEREELKDLSLLSSKPQIIVLNVSESEYNPAGIKKVTEEYKSVINPHPNPLPKGEGDQGDNTGIVVICAQIESELAQLSDEEQKQYLKDLGLSQSGLERLIQKAYQELGLISFLTAGEKEVRAWTIKKGTTAQLAAGEIHTDFIKKFIKAEVVGYDDFINPGGLASPKPSEGGWKGSREKGKARLEGKEYIMQDGDVVEFKIGS